eukprot:PhF_6_TR14086/c0_g1_i1/m.22503/K01173/ENDOG; endonuclease G, mitochondrial
MQAVIVLSAVLVGLFGIPSCDAAIGFNGCKSLFHKGFFPDQYQPSTPLCKLGVLAISYDNAMLNPAFSAYYVTPAEVKQDAGGRMSFYEDVELQNANVAQAPLSSQVFKAGYDRGHNAPSDVLSYNKTVQTQCYTMANIAPQISNFNRGVWAQLEADVRSYISSSNTALHIITGVGYQDRTKADRPYDNIAIPSYFFKVICDPKGKKSAGFYGENAANGGGTTTTFRTVKYIEDNIYGGQLIDASCNTGTVNPSDWWQFKK